MGFDFKTITNKQKEVEKVENVEAAKPPGAKPTFFLKKKVEGSKDHPVDVSGLWEKESKNGLIYFNGFDKQKRIGYTVFMNTDKASGEPDGTFSLHMSKEGEKKGKKIVQRLEEFKNKKGEPFFSGKTDTEEVTYYLMPYRPKS